MRSVFTRAGPSRGLAKHHVIRAGLATRNASPQGPPRGRCGRRAGWPIPVTVPIGDDEPPRDRPHRARRAPEATEPDINAPVERPEVLAALAAGDDDESTDDIELPAPVIDVNVAGSPRADGGLLGYSALGAYLQELRVHPLLSRDEEHTLAVRFAKTGDSAAARRLITANLRLVVKISQEYRRAHKQPARPHPGGEHRPHPGGAEVRSLPRRQAVVVRRLVDPRLHPQVHPGQLAHREDRDHPGPAQAVLQPAQGAREAGEDGLRGRGAAPGGGAGRQRAGRRRDGAPAGLVGDVAGFAGPR